MENKTTPEAIADLSEIHPPAVAELERWQFLLAALGHDSNARIVCENHIEELLGDYEGAEHIDDVNGISEERDHTLGDLNILAGASYTTIDALLESLENHVCYPATCSEAHSWMSCGLDTPGVRDRSYIEAAIMSARSRSQLETLTREGLMGAIAKINSLERIIGHAVDVLEAYCDDHDSDHPTDVTVMLPELRRAGELTGKHWMRQVDRQEGLFSE